MMPGLIELMRAPRSPQFVRPSIAAALRAVSLVIWLMARGKPSVSVVAFSLPTPWKPLRPTKMDGNEMGMLPWPPFDC